MSDSTSTKFLRLNNDKERKAFYAELQVSTWWTAAAKEVPVSVDVFEKSDGKCVYCSRDLIGRMEKTSFGGIIDLLPIASD